MEEARWTKKEEWEEEKTYRSRMKAKEEKEYDGGKRKKGGIGKE